MYTVRYKLSTAPIAYEQFTNVKTRSKKEAREFANQLRNELKNEYLYPTAMVYIVKLKKLTPTEARKEYGKGTTIHYFDRTDSNKHYTVWVNTELEACIKDNDSLFIDV